MGRELFDVDLDQGYFIRKVEEKENENLHLKNWEQTFTALYINCILRLGPKEKGAVSTYSTIIVNVTETKQQQQKHKTVATRHAIEADPSNSLAVI